MKLKKEFTGKEYILYGLGIIAIFLIWEVIALIVGNTTAIFPDPIKTIPYVFSILGQAYFYKSLAYSLLKILIGFSASFVVALLLGIIAGCNKDLQTFLHPIMTVLKAIPTAALVLLFLVMLGAKNSPILIVFLICFPILYESVVGGFNNVPNHIDEAMAVDGGKTLRGIFKIKLPLSFPSILIGISSSFALSFKIEIMAEIISGDTSYGLGTAISFAQTSNPSNMIPVFAYAFLVIILMLIVTLAAHLIKRALKK